MSSSPVFVHLNVHSDYSFGEGASKLAGIIAEAKRLRIPAFALTDRNNMHGALEFSKKGTAAGIQPIIGAKLQIPLGDKLAGSITLLAQTEQGYQNLCSLVSDAHAPELGASNNSSLGPTLDTEKLAEHAAGLILLTGGADGMLNKLLRAERYDDASAALQFLGYHFCDRLYIEICRNGAADDEDVRLEELLLDLAFDESLVIEGSDGSRRTGVPIVATAEVRYATEHRHDAWEILRAVEGKGSVSMAGDEILPATAKRYHMRSAEEMHSLFSDLPEAVENAVLIAQRCGFMAKGRKPILPHFGTHEGRSEADELRAQARDGLRVQLEKLGFPDDPDAVVDGISRRLYEERLEYELDVIDGMGFPGYFLIVADFIKWAKSKNIPVGPGRGSGAGSVVAWALTITGLDPLRFGLLFERFLNPERVSMPDFDIDFCQLRRGEVIRYVQERYGRDHVAQIVTFMEIKSKTALKDVARVISHDKFGGYGYAEVDQLCKVIPKREDSPEPKKLADAFKDESEFRERVEASDKMRILFANALSVEGLYRSDGAHAAGIIIGGQPLHELVPLGWDNKTNLPTSQFNMKDAESSGLVKFDFLGLTTLSVMNEALSHIRDFRGLEIDLSAIPLDDPDVFALFAEARTNGVFQFESEGMKRVLRQVRPDRIEDLIAVNALFRPGPMDQIDHYAACKNGTAEPRYPDPVDRTKPFLEETFGIMVYQEQVMRVAQEVAGYTLGGADLLRRAMGKKIKEEMDRERAKFVSGAAERGTPKRDAEELFDHIAKFAGYGFNKSHAAAYSLVAYQTAWLKVHYPAEFFAAVLTFEVDKPERMALIKDDMEEMGLTLLPPDINKSFSRFRPEPHEASRGGFGIRFGLSGIKGISGTLDGLVSARRGGEFVSLLDFHQRAGGTFNRGQIEKLSEAGAFDAIADCRYQAASVLSWLAANMRKSDRQTDMFGDSAGITIPKHVRDVREWGDKMDREFRSVGFWFNTHPLDGYRSRLERSGVRRKFRFVDYMRQTGTAEIPSRKLAGLVMEVTRVISRRGFPYVKALLAEKNDQFDVLFFGSDNFPVDRIRSTLEGAKASRKPVVIVADLNLKEGTTDLTAFGREAWDIDEFLSNLRGNFVMRVSPDHVMQTADERRASSDAEEAFQRGDITEDVLQTRLKAVRDTAFARRIGDIRSFIDTLREDDHPDAVELRMEVPLDGKLRSVRFHGRYRMTAAAEGTIKAFDGVVSFLESGVEGSAPSTAQEPAAEPARRMAS